MIPINDSQKTQHTPYANYALIIINVIVFFIVLAMEFRALSEGKEAGSFFFEWGFVHARYTTDIPSSFFQLLFTPVISIFLHNGLIHILFNMLMLWTLGDNIEDLLGSLRYLLFYFLCGIAACLSDFLSAPFLSIPTVGASGAIAGVMAAYFFLYPVSNIRFFFPPAFKFEIPAYLFIFFWFVGQFEGVLRSKGGIAWWAHIGGFLMGLLLIMLWVRLPKGYHTNKIDEHNEQTPVTENKEEIQTIRHSSIDDAGNLHGYLFLTKQEARTGCIKQVNIPKGITVRLCKVDIHPETVEGETIRLQGFGKTLADGNTGDMILTIIFFGSKIPKKLEREHEPELQIVRPRPEDGTADLFADIFLTRSEAFSGCTKLLDIPRKFRIHFCKVDIPAHVAEGQKICIPGLGQRLGDKDFGKLILTVQIIEEEGAGAPENMLTKDMQRELILSGVKIVRINPQGDDSENRHANIFLTCSEATAGCTKIINLSRNGEVRLHKVDIPAGSLDGHKLPVKGLGRKAADGGAGDLILTLKINRPLKQRLFSVESVFVPL